MNNNNKIQAIGREDIKELLVEVNIGEILVLNCKGSKKVRIREDKHQCVEFIKDIDGDRLKTVMTLLDLREKYIVARYNVYKGKDHSDDYKFIRDYGVVLPYDSILSIDIERE